MVWPIGKLVGISQMLAAPVERVDTRVEGLLDENRRLQREVEKWKQAAATGGGNDYLSRVQEVDGIKLLAAEVDGQDAAGLRLVLDKLREKFESGVVVLGGNAEGKASLCVSVSKDLVGRIKGPAVDVPCLDAHDGRA